MHKFIYISFLLLFFLPDVQAQKKYLYQDSSLLQKETVNSVTTKEVTIVEAPAAVDDDEIIYNDEQAIDTALYLNSLQLPVDSMQRWKNLKDYAYAKKLDSLLQEKNRKNKKEVKPARQSSGSGLMNNFLQSSFLKILLWTLAGCFVLFIMYRLFLADGVFQRRSKKFEKTDIEAEEEIITPESNFDALIKQALQNNNYRQAVRYQYLRTLHLLAGKSFIALAPDKTNFQYVSEINNADYRNDFAALTLNYEYVWYGEFEIENNIYQKIESGFTNLNKKI